MRQRAFSLIELLVVISIIAVLAGMLLPAIALARGSAKATQCRSNMRQAFLAYNSYADDNEGALPRQSYSAGILQAYNPNDVHAGQAAYLNEHPCSRWSNHHPAVFVCPEAAARVQTYPAEPYPCFQLPTYFMNTDAWAGWSQFAKPQNNSSPPKAIAAILYPLLIENEPSNAGGYHWDFAPSTRFLWAHHGTMNVLFFDGHVGAIRPAQLIMLSTGDTQ